MFLRHAWQRFNSCWNFCSYYQSASGRNYHICKSITKMTGYVIYHKKIANCETLRRWLILNWQWLNFPILIKCSNWWLNGKFSIGTQKWTYNWQNNTPQNVGTSGYNLYWSVHISSLLWQNTQCPYTLEVLRCTSVV